MRSKIITSQDFVQFESYLQEEEKSKATIEKYVRDIHAFFRFMGWKDCRVKNLKIQRMTYCPEDKELSKSEYMRLLEAAKEQPQLELILQTICGTGIRVSELSYFTVEAVRTGEIHIFCKNKNRTILIPGKLRKMLLNFAKRNKISEGILFRTKNGKPLNRSNIWSRMKKLCMAAKVNPKKVFPHNLRKLFAKTFYNMEKDIAKLADSRL